MNMLAMLVLLSSLVLPVMTVLPIGASGSAANNGPAPEQHCASDRTFTDPCGTSVQVTKGCVSLKFEKVKDGPNKGKKCITKITVGSGDVAEVTVPPGSQVEIQVNGTGSVTVNADGQGQIDDMSPSKSMPGIVISGDGKNTSHVQVNGASNVVQLDGAKHKLTINGNNNIVLKAGSNNVVVLNGNNNTVY